MSASTNGASSSSSSTANSRPPPPPSHLPQPDFHPSFSPNGAHQPSLPRPQFNNPYHPPTPAPLPMPPLNRIPPTPASPVTLAPPSTYPAEYQSSPRDKPSTAYYDPTSDSGDRRQVESGWNDRGSQTPKVSISPEIFFPTLLSCLIDNISTLENSYLSILNYPSSTNVLNFAESICLSSCPCS